MLNNNTQTSFPVCHCTCCHLNVEFPRHTCDGFRVPFTVVPGTAAWSRLVGVLSNKAHIILFLLMYFVIYKSLFEVLYMIIVGEVNSTDYLSTCTRIFLPDSCSPHLGAVLLTR